MIKLQALPPGTLWNVLHAPSEDSSLSIPEQQPQHNDSIITGSGLHTLHHKNLIYITPSKQPTG
jgi:hypothetical protein